MKTIPLTQGKEALIDDWNFADVSRFKWRAQYGPSAKTWYAVRSVTLPNKKQFTEMMHRRIRNPGAGFDVDHKDHNGLNNQEHNLRNCTRRQNMENTRNQSQYGAGVNKDKGRYYEKPFRATAWIGKKGFFCGRFATPEEAQEARRRFLAEHEKEKHVT